MTLAILIATTTLLGPGPESPRPAEGMDAIIAPGAAPEVIVSGLKFSEGPVWEPGTGGSAGALLFSDIPAQTIYRWTEGRAGADARPEIFRTPTGHANGLTIDKDGRVLAAEHDGRVTRRSLDGKMETLAEKFDGKSLNSPNDLCVQSDGTVWFTDPTYGLRPALGSGGRKQELEFCGVYRLGPGGVLTLASKEMTAPNGIALSPDESTLYVADTSKGEIRAFAVTAGGTLGEGRLFADMKTPEGPRAGQSAGPDGVKVDAKGNVYCAAYRGVWVFDPAGRQIGLIRIPEKPTNLCFGGADMKTLFVTTGQSVYKVPVKIAGRR